MKQFARLFAGHRRALVNIARGLDIKVIITGIENSAHLQAVKPLRTDGYQGYIAPPVDLPL